MAGRKVNQPVYGRCWIIALVGMLALPGQLAADSMRCGRALLKTGDSVSTLRSRCGEPSSRDSAYASLRHVNGGKRTRVARWHYRFGRGGLEKIVLLYEDAVVGIETGSRS